MSEWWTYRPSDFLMFSPRIYWRLFASINESFWPLQPLVIALALAWLARARAHRVAAGALALAVAVVAWAFLWQRFAPINWPARGFAIAFAVLAVLLVALSIGPALRGTSRWPRRRFGGALIAWALLGQPLLAPAFGRPWLQAEVFALAPDPTAIATLGWLLLVEADGRSRIVVRLAVLIASLWLAASAAMLATMGSWQALVPATALLGSCLARMSIHDLRRRATPPLR